MSSAVIQAVYDWLAADTGAGGFCNTSTGIGTRLFHVSGPESFQGFPACVFVVSGPANPERFFGTGAFEPWMLTFSIWVNAETSTDVAAMALDQALFTRLEGKSLTVTGYDRMLATNAARGACDVDDDGIRVDSEWVLRGMRTT